jgi:PilZ domain
MNIEEQRHFRRASLNSQGKAIANDITMPLLIRNISLGGCCVEMPQQPSLKTGMSVKIHIPIMGISAKAIVRWLSSSVETLIAGLEFQDLLSAVETTSS